MVRTTESFDRYSEERRKELYRQMGRLAVEMRQRHEAEANKDAREQSISADRKSVSP
jgi:hypothetical protein